MAIPTRSEIKPVILAVLADGGTHHSTQLQEIAARHFRLTDEELKLKRGKHRWFENEHAFALNLLVQDKMIKNVDAPSAVAVIQLGWKRWYAATRRGLEVAKVDAFRIRP